jgi:hypothetical protein
LLIVKFYAFSSLLLFIYGAVVAAGAGKLAKLLPHWLHGILPINLNTPLAISVNTQTEYLVLLFIAQAYTVVQFAFNKG